jgi:hypothetical protein
LRSTPPTLQNTSRNTIATCLKTGLNSAVDWT